MGPFLRAIGEALRQGPAGVARERLVSFEPCPVPLEGSSVAIFLWHGELDTMVPCVAAEYLACKIPNCKVTIWPDEGHIDRPPLGRDPRRPGRLTAGVVAGD